MPAKLLWSFQAREDLLDIYVAIGMENAEAAERLYSAIETKANLLITHPRIGVRRSEIRPSARMLIEGAYLILYETRPDADEIPAREVEIVRIVDGRRDLTRPF
jgi:toxin ParE1/3/4